jgi:hypothetical protein
MGADLAQQIEESKRRTEERLQARIKSEEEAEARRMQRN